MENEIEEIEVYCKNCNSCGELGCCEPDKCKSVQLNLVIKDVLKDMSLETEEFCVEYFIDQIQVRFKDGLYCDSNLQSYKELGDLADKYHQALVDITKAESPFDMFVIAQTALED
jgi:hypothetical protein